LDRANTVYYVTDIECEELRNRVTPLLKTSLVVCEERRAVYLAARR
jgi:hypothetical protein